MSILGLEQGELRTFDTDARSLPEFSVATDDSSDGRSRRRCVDRSDAWLAVTAVAWAARILALMLLLGGASLFSLRAEAQREVVEDSWDQAARAMAHDEGGATLPATWLDGPSRGPHEPSWRERRRASRARRAAEAEATVSAMAEATLRARDSESGSLTLQLRAGRGLDWIWLGRDAQGPWHYRFAHGPSLCQGRCTVHVDPGTYTLGLRSPQLRGAVAAPFTLERSGTLYAHYETGNARRRGGIALMVLGMTGMVVGVLRTIVGIPWFCDSEHESCEADIPLYAKLAFFGGLAGFGIGAVLIFTARRHLELEFRPGLSR